MKIVVNLDVMMARRKMSLGELAQRVDITMANLSILKEQQGEGHPFFYAGGHLCPPGLPAGGHSGVVPDGEGEP